MEEDAEGGGEVSGVEKELVVVWKEGEEGPRAGRANGDEP